MARCEDFPCCGHELGCCPRFDEETGAQLDMVCLCGAHLPVNRPYSICDGCLREGGIEDPIPNNDWPSEDCEELESADFESEEETS